jgi:hypothetical protein
MPGESWAAGLDEGWCGRGDLNPYGLPRQILSLVRLPISPLPHYKQFTGKWKFEVANLAVLN